VFLVLAVILTEFSTSRRCQRHSTVSPFAECDSNSVCCDSSVPSLRSGCPVVPFKRTCCGASTIFQRGNTTHSVYLLCMLAGWLVGWLVCWFVGCFCVCFRP